MPNPTMPNPIVRSIFVCSTASEPMHEIAKVMALAGAGLEGDRYSLGKGTYSQSPRPVKRHATLIAAADIEAARQAGFDFLPSETRRNIVVEGISPDELNQLVGKTLQIGAALVLALEICQPCESPSELSGKPGFPQAFKHTGGLRLEILKSGTIQVGDAISVQS